MLAIAIRLAAETFMLKKINDPAFAAGITARQTQVLMKKFRSSLGAIPQLKH